MLNESYPHCYGNKSMSISQSERDKPFVALGLNENHDASAAIIQDGTILAAIAEERISRRKHHAHSVVSSVEYVLEASGLTLADVDIIVSSGHGTEPVDADDQAKAYREHLLSQSAPWLIYPSHHEVHAVHSAITSGWDTCAVMVYDGIGSPTNLDQSMLETIRDATEKGLLDEKFFEAETHYSWSNGHLLPLYRRPSTYRPYVPNRELISIGRLYSYVSKYIFGRRQDSGKTMALGAFGQPSRHPLITIRDNVPSVAQSALTDLPRGRAYEDDPTGCADLAATLQRDVVSTMTYMASMLQSSTQHARLCLAGGVALNCPANRAIVNGSGFGEVFVPSAPTDDGLAIGAAFLGALIGGVKPTSFSTANRSPYLGKQYAEATIRQSLEKCAISLDVNVERFEGVLEAIPLVAKLLAAGKIVGWFNGRSEFGPRALGSRCILADPRSAAVKDFLNTHVKNRELFRPFAPAVLADYADGIFDIPPGFESPYMSFTATARKNWIDIIPAVLHVDNSARLQTVRSDHAPHFAALIEQFRKITGIPLLLNTSFNGANEPLVETPTEAIRLFSNTPIDVLVLENYVVQKAISPSTYG
jgi:carbamoyltransferase